MTNTGNKGPYKIVMEEALLLVRKLKISPSRVRAAVEITLEITVLGKWIAVQCSVNIIEVFSHIEYNIF